MGDGLGKISTVVVEATGLVLAGVTVQIILAMITGIGYSQIAGYIYPVLAIFSFMVLVADTFIRAPVLRPFLGIYLLAHLLFHIVSEHDGWTLIIVSLVIMFVSGSVFFIQGLRLIFIKEHYAHKRLGSLLLYLIFYLGLLISMVVGPIVMNSGCC